MRFYAVAAFALMFCWCEDLFGFGYDLNLLPLRCLVDWFVVSVGYVVLVVMITVSGCCFLMIAMLIVWYCGVC